MNDSGQSVGAALRFYKLDPQRLLVVHDEIDLPLGDVRAKLGGGLAGHNGLRSLVQHLKTQDFARVRIGVGRPERGDPRSGADWVLTPFEPHADVPALVMAGADCAMTVIRDGIDVAMQKFNGR
jgi:peptidyl-tRNA hydrolase, PTH1 family